MNKIIKTFCNALTVAALALVGISTVHANTLTVDVGDFVNYYDIDTSIAYISAEKELDGKDLEADEFSFVLYDEDGNEVETVTNDSDGTISFSGIEIDEEGTYVYTIEEVDDGLDYIEYDDSVFTVTIVAEIDSDSEALELTITYDDDPVFENTYTPEEVEVTLTATKTFTDGKLYGNDFSFNLLDDDYDVLATVKNAADGDIEFGTFTYTAAGTYTYYAVEVAGADDDIDYDDNTYEITVTVTDDGEGTLSASVSDEPEFVNTYEEADSTDNDDTDYHTGDTIYLGVVIGLVIAAIGIVLLWLFKHIGNR